jgi:enoyl-[acyl-carrier-protein] reductase (NADH)
MVNRKEDQGQEAIEKIKGELGDDAKIEWTPCDLGSLKNVKEVFTRIQEQEERLDLVIYLLGASLQHRMLSTTSIDIAHSFRRHQRKPIRPRCRRHRPPFRRQLAGPILRHKPALSLNP